jgi:predicted RNase H-like nuclease (RuvC/YqgF family)
MVHIFLLILILLLPASSEAAYKIYLKNGSVITGVSSYEKKGGEITIFFGGGSLGIPEKDIVKIEETEAPEKDFGKEEAPGAEVGKAPAEVPAEEPAISEKTERADALQADLDAVNAELKTVEDNEARVKASIDEKLSQRSRYNVYQMRYLEQEIEPLQQELSTIQQKKGELLQRKAYREGELRSLK